MSNLRIAAKILRDNDQDCIERKVIQIRHKLAETFELADLLGHEDEDFMEEIADLIIKRMEKRNELYTSK